MKKIERFLIYITVVLGVVFCLGFAGAAAQEKMDVAVASFSVKNIEKGIELQWSSVDNAKSYKLYRLTSKGTYKRIGTADKTENIFVDESASAGKKYTYKVKPYSKSFNGVSKASKEIYRVPMSGFTSIGNTASGISLEWSKSAGADKYYLYRKQEGDKKWTKLKTLKATSYCDTQVESGINYIYRIKAKKGSDYSLSDEARLMFLSAPVISSLKNKSDSIEIKWKEVKGATGYTILRKAPGGKWKKLVSVKGDILKYKDLTAKENVKYGYAVRAENTNGKSVYLKDKYCVRLLPIAVSSTKNMIEGVQLKWKKCDSAAGYRVYRSEAGSGTKKKIATVKNKNTTSYVDKTVISGVKYTYYLVQYTGSSYSACVKGAERTFVASPEELKAKKDGSRVVLSWKKVTGSTNYDIYRKTGNKGEWAKLVSLGDKTTYTDKTAKNNTVYYYRIRASVSNKYYSAYSEEIRSSRVDPSKKMIALTYDDGPAGDSTKRILDVLEKYDARATFFVLGSRIPSYYKNLQRADKLGCEIANHTYSHINLPSNTNSTILNEINKTNSLVKQYTGKTPALIRAPGGSTNQRVRECVNMPFIYWSIDTRDWEHRSASKTIASVKNNARDGAIVLMHDIHAPTATASETIIPWLINQGYQLVTVSELMEYRGIKMRAGTTYYNAYK
ncbi:MAG: polysaccharide deacetylase family protein [Acutalibacteraceae bacterium]|nr:polysaccharide deacetylase family protein [Acutalibacteraceae bacterium]